MFPLVGGNSYKREYLYIHSLNYAIKLTYIIPDSLFEKNTIVGDFSIYLFLVMGDYIKYIYQVFLFFY